MTRIEVDRYSLLKQVLSKQLTQVHAAQILGLSDRQVRNLLKKVKLEGPEGIVSKKRGKASNRALNSKFKSQVMDVVKEKYSDFGPTFAKEKLQQYHRINISTETLRKWMIQEGLWLPRQKLHRIHPLRARREYFGELIQIDASHHLWFENRAEKCALIVFIDDATSKITSLFFCPSECLEGYFSALEIHLKKYGRPLELYSDRHAIFGGSDKIHHAQFVRALNELGIKRVLANSPQAKGRVERVNKTLQDRLIKEMRLRNISSLEDGNRYLAEFIEEFNKKFSKEPKGSYDAHRPLDAGIDLERILTRYETRILSKDLSFSLNNTNYQILEPTLLNRLRNKRVEIRKRSDGLLRVFCDEKELRYIPLEQFIEDSAINKERLIWTRGRGRPRAPQNINHPWKKYRRYKWAS